MSVAQVYQGIWSISCKRTKLAVEYELYSKPTDLKIHLCRTKDTAGVSREVLDIHSSALSLSMVKLFFTGDNPNNLGRFVRLYEARGPIIEAYIFALSLDHWVYLLANHVNV